MTLLTILLTFFRTGGYLDIDEILFVKTDPPNPINLAITSVKSLTPST